MTDVNATLPRLLLKVNPDGSRTMYVYGHGLILQETIGDDSSYRLYHYDYRGSTKALTNDEGKVTDKMSYSPYGGLETRDGDTQTIFLYVGREGIQTDGNGLLYMRARYYNPEVERLVNEDPIRDGDNWNAYCDGDPVNRTDPSGNYWVYGNSSVSWYSTATKKYYSSEDQYNRKSSMSHKLMKTFYGSQILAVANELGVDVNYLGGVILTESNGSGFSDDRLIIRFEVNWFNKFTKKRYIKFFKLNNGNRYYKSKGKWKIINGSDQKENYASFNLAKKKSQAKAYKSISMGMFQIMGFNCKEAGYSSAKKCTMIMTLVVIDK